MDNITSLINKWDNSYKKFVKIGNEIGELICKQLNPVIPDITYSLGWAEAGVDTICFWSESKSKCIFSIDIISLDSIISEVFPELFVDCPFGVYLNKTEAKKVKNLLLKLKLEEV